MKHLFHAEPFYNIWHYGGKCVTYNLHIIPHFINQIIPLYGLGRPLPICSFTSKTITFAIRKNSTFHFWKVLSSGGEGGIPFLRKSHGGCNVPPAHCQEPPFESHLQGKQKDRPFGRSLTLAEKVGFEPTWRVTANSISSRARYDHFDTSP